jgi:hypothetical protein
MTTIIPTKLRRKRTNRPDLAQSRREKAHPSTTKPSFMVVIYSFALPTRRRSIYLIESKIPINTMPLPVVYSAQLVHHKTATSPYQHNWRILLQPAYESNLKQCCSICHFHHRQPYLILQHSLVSSGPI